jgi:hypothetical protein
MADDVPLGNEGIEIVTPEADKIQFSRQIWQAASEQAHRSLARRNFCPDQSRVENLHCVHLEDETETNFGRQLWCFDAIGMDAAGHRHVLYGSLEFSIQYGLLEASNTSMFDDLEHRDTFLTREKTGPRKFVYSYPSTRFWVVSAWASIAVLGGIWIAALTNFLYNR